MDALSCPKCSYNLTSLFVQELDVVTCPECGSMIERRHATSRAASRWPLPWLRSILIGLPVPACFFVMGVLSMFPDWRQGVIALAFSGPLISLAAAWTLHVRSDSRNPVVGSKLLFMICVFVGAIIANYAAMVVAGIALVLVAMPRH